MQDHDKFQITSTKLHTKFKNKITIYLEVIFGNWDFQFIWNLEFGFWNLKKIPDLSGIFCSEPGRILPTMAENSLYRDCKHLVS
jgi:hypothetical protein